MNRIQLLLCLFGISTSFLINLVQARSERRLEGEGIQGGEEAKEGRFPYQIILEADGKNICGGSILSERFVVTAAHCVLKKDNTFAFHRIRVVAGIDDLKSKSASRVVVDVIEVFVPKEYDATSYERLKVRSIGDIAILKLNKDLDLENNQYLAKVTLPRKHKTYEGKKAIITGFGYNTIDVVKNPKTGKLEEVNGKRFDKMRFAEANVLSHQECQKYYSVVKVAKTHMCAFLVQHNKLKPEGVCSGDSGGPLMYKDVQIGVVSTSPLGCREDSKPAVYTRVSEYLRFIRRVVNGKIDQKIRQFTLKI